MWEKLTRLQKLIATILSVIALLTICYQGQAVFARDAELQLVSMRLDKKILNDDRSYLQQRVWSLEKHYEEKRDPEDLQEIRMLKQEIRTIDEQMKGGK